MTEDDFPSPVSFILASSLIKQVMSLFFTICYLLFLPLMSPELLLSPDDLFFVLFPLVFVECSAIALND